MSAGPRDSLLTRLTPAARSVVMSAEKHALSLGHERIGSEHLLLALLDLEPSPAVQVLADLGFLPADLRPAVVESLPRGHGAVVPPVPFSSHARTSLENGMREAVACGSTDIGPEHLLLGILRAGDRGAGALLLALGVDRAAAQRAVAALPERRGGLLARWRRRSR